MAAPATKQEARDPFYVAYEAAARDHIQKRADVGDCQLACSSIDAMEAWCTFVPVRIRPACIAIAATLVDEKATEICRDWCDRVF